jgi:prepilin-type N-terminal cleavage/methylation domain-containing protein
MTTAVSCEPRAVSVAPVVASTTSPPTTLGPRRSSRLTARGSGLRFGFTLWEMSIVLAISAVAALLVIPAWTNLGENQPPEAGNMITSLLRDARRTAISQRQTVIVRIDPATGMFRVDTTGAAGTGLFADGSLTVNAWESLETDLARLTYVFRPTGAAWGDSVVVRGAEQTIVISVNPWSGEPVIYAQ